ncbi:MAG: SRPBCC family protein [Ramlibacter sp.]
MWTSSYSKTIKGLTAQQVWDVWTDVNQWHTWQDDIDYARLEGEFRSGNSFKFRPKGGPDINIELTRVEAACVFVDVTRFPLAKMVDSHELIERDDGLEIKTTLTLQGPLSFLWRKLVAENIARDLPVQTDRLIAKARRGKDIAVPA